MKQLTYPGLFALLLSLILAAAGCSSIDYVKPTTPESLLDQSSERVAFSLGMENSIDEITEWMNQDQPTRAEISCDGGAACAEIVDALNQFGVPHENKASLAGRNEVVLLYERIFTRDCDQDASSFGCATAANTVQMVVDPRQFVDPALLDLQDAEKSAQVFDKYLKKHPYQK